MTNPLEHAKPGDRIEVTIKGTIGSIGPGHLAISVGDEDSLIYFSPTDLDHCKVVVKPAMPTWQDGDIVVGYDGAYAMDGVFRRRAGWWFNEHIAADPRGLDDEFIEKCIDEHGYRVLVAKGRPVLPAPAPKGEVPHDFESAEGASGMACTALVTDREGHGTDCGMPASDPIHHGGK